MKKKIRVVQYGVGPIGASIVRLMRQKVSLEIVGAIDTDPAKAGRDLTDTFVGTLFEGKVVYDKTFGHVTYGCSQCCADDTAWLMFSPLSMGVGGTASNSVEAQDCNGFMIDVSARFVGHWTTTNPGIATVDANGHHTGVATGSTTTNTYGLLVQQGYHKCPLVSTPASGGDNVMVNVTCPLTNLALAPGAPPTATTGICTATVSPAGGTFSWSASKNTVAVTPNGLTATYNAANASTSTGDTTISVTYTVNGQAATAQSSAMTVHKPTSLNIVSDSGSVQNVNCDAMYPNQGLNYCGVHRDILYVVIDQLGTAISIAGLPAVEVFVPGANSCGIAPPTPAGTLTLSNGNFGGPDVISLCTTACLPAQNCIPAGSCTMYLTQTWSVGGVPVRTNALTFQCTNISVVPQ